MGLLPQPLSNPTLISILYSLLLKRAASVVRSTCCSSRVLLLTPRTVDSAAYRSDTLFWPPLSYTQECAYSHTDRHIKKIFKNEETPRVQTPNGHIKKQVQRHEGVRLWSPPCRCRGQAEAHILGSLHDQLCLCSYRPRHSAGGLWNLPSLGPCFSIQRNFWEMQWSLWHVPLPHSSQQALCAKFCGHSTGPF